MTNDNNKRTWTYKDYRRLSHRLAQGLDVWAKGYHIVAVPLPEDIVNPCQQCTMKPYCDHDLCNICEQVDDRNGCYNNLKMIDNDPPAQLA